MAMNRRAFLRTSAISAAALSTLSLKSFSAFAADNAINIASLYDNSGGLDIYGKPIVDALTFAVEELNSAGGLLGSPLNLIKYDTQQAALKDRAAAVHAGITSASREVVRPVLDRSAMQQQRLLVNNPRTVLEADALAICTAAY